MISKSLKYIDVKYKSELIHYTGFAQIFGCKIKNFFQTFSKMLISFSRPKFIYIVCPMMHCEHTVTTMQCWRKRDLRVLGLRLNVFDKGEILNKIWLPEKFTYQQSTCFSFQAKKFYRLFTIFPDFIFIFQTFSRSGKLVCKFPDFFKNSRLCTNPDYISTINFSRLLKLGTSLQTCSTSFNKSFIKLPPL